MVSARRIVIVLALLIAIVSLGAQAQERFITVASTTSTEQSGLFNHLLPICEKETGIKIRVVALGTGQALDLARRGDNDFVLIGPKSDPAKVAGGKDITEALKKVQAAQAPFVSRGDKSGTHLAELDLWKVSGVDIEKAKGPWYRDTGQGMGPALNTAVSMNAYVLSDRATWLAFKNRGDLAIAVEGDKRLYNQYGVMLVNPAQHPTVKKDLGQAFVDWLISPAGQKAIADYKIGGEQLFFPNAGQSGV